MAIVWIILYFVCGGLIGYFLLVLFYIIIMFYKSWHDYECKSGGTFIKQIEEIDNGD